MPLPRTSSRDLRSVAPSALAALSFLVLFWAPMATLVRDWWSDPEAGHGLLLAPLAVYLAWKRGISSDARPAPVLRITLLAGAVLRRYGAGLAAELLTMRLSFLGALGAFVVYRWGVRQLADWWLPVALLTLGAAVTDGEEAAFALASRIEAEVMPALARALPPQAA